MCWVVMLVRGILLLTCVYSVSCAHIMFAMITGSASHNGNPKAMAIELANRGHHVEFVTSHRLNFDHSNVTEVYMEQPEKYTPDFMMEKYYFWLTNPATAPVALMYLLTEVCTATLVDHPLSNRVFWRTHDIPDIVIHDEFFQECLYPLKYKWNAPIVLLGVAAGFPFNQAAMGMALSPAVQPLEVLPYQPGELTFPQRILSFLLVHGFTLSTYLMAPVNNANTIKYFGAGYPTIWETQTDIDLVLTLNHYDFGHTRPLLPNYVEIGCISCGPGKPLPSELDEFIAGAGEHGFIFFSLGTVISKTINDRMTSDELKAILATFAALPQRVIWKFENYNIPELPANVRLGNFFPQQDLLADPRCRLFITHCGLNSVQEIMYHGVPIVAMPGMADQFHHSRVMISRGMGVGMTIQDAPTKIFGDNIREVISDPKYAAAAKTRSKYVKDRAIPPLDLAVYWIEYTLRHGGTKHLRYAGSKVNFVQYYCLDVIAVLLSIGGLMMFLLLQLCRCCCRGAKMLFLYQYY